MTISERGGTVYEDTGTSPHTVISRNDERRERREGPVHEALDSVDKQIERLRDTIARLRIRLVPVSNPSLEADKRGPSPEPVLSPVAGRLHTQYAQLVEANDVIEALIEQLEI